MSAFRSKNNLGGSPYLDNRTDILIKESQSLRNSSQMVDDAIETGIAVNERLFNQMSTMSNSNQTFQAVIGKIPYIGDLTNKIQVKRKRDRMILGSLIGFLMFFCVWYLFG
ncbi:Golgi SNAP receptor complex member 1-like protein [Tritrichomonas foetus]|uniref:Golgi SNAP receptor complex member 1-like protein n=1 Tax=Tritrichomonas foetus TaxID=1144522 RepID=A0A1J4JNJ6_9EUKA|nr:Golgi SNAP receptor complex member 1-like protein [Tritrichomonas foetus]|eukprot:OHS99085.1 Golgi SNAP receptor complex member 1-like protein [Tritrichomonas foetus]